MTTAADMIARLKLAPHPEGGWYRETWLADAAPGERPVGTAIFFLLAAGQASHWHRVDATEIWFYHAGAPLTLRQSPHADGPARADTLGGNVMAGEMPQLIVPTGAWQSAATLGDWTLVSCTVSPGFRFEGFELAVPGFDIP